MSTNVLPLHLPPYPSFCASGDVYVWGRYDKYLDRFDKYSREMVKLQVATTRQSMVLAERVAAGSKVTEVTAVADEFKRLLDVAVSEAVSAVSAAVSKSAEVKACSCGGVPEWRKFAEPLGGKLPEVAVERGRHYVANKAKREKRKSKSGGRASVPVGVAQVGKTELQTTLEGKWMAENKLRTLEADRKYQVLMSDDVDAVKKRRATKIVRETEQNKVQTEQAFGYLRGTGNVPGCAKTVVSDGTGPVPSLSRSNGTTVSPDSSVSQQEIRQMQKDILDKDARIAELESMCLADPGSKPPVKALTSYTLDSQGRLPDHAPECLYGYEEGGRFVLGDFDSN